MRLVEIRVLFSHCRYCSLHLLRHCSQAVREKKNVSVSGFGSFKTRVSKAYTARNPRTRAEIPVPSKNRIKFTAAESFKRTTETEVAEV